MSHTPFILAAYSFAVVLMAWCALAPVFQIRKLRNEILGRLETMEQTDASDT